MVRFTHPTDLTAGYALLPSASSMAFSSPRALLSVSLLFAGGHAVGHDAGAGLDVGLVVVDDEGSQGDAGVHVAGEIDVADRAGIGAAAVRLQLVDDLHRAGPSARR